MLVGEARQIAAVWARARCEAEEEVLGAYIAGSLARSPGEVPMSPSSDVDVVLVARGERARPKPGKFRHQGVLVEATYIPWSVYEDVESLLLSAPICEGLRTNTIVCDKEGMLLKVQAQVERRFGEAGLVKARMKATIARIRQGILSLEESAPTPAFFTGWLFPTGIMAHVVLVAALENPTVRLRYQAAKRVLSEYGMDTVYEELIGFLVEDRFTPERAAGHVRALEAMFDDAAARIKTPVFFQTDISAVSRHVAIDGAYRLIERGLHREAAFWMGATFARCGQILLADAPEVFERHRPAFDLFFRDLGICEKRDCLERGARVLEYLPRLYRHGLEILKKNPSVAWMHESPAPGAGYR